MEKHIPRQGCTQRARGRRYLSGRNPLEHDFTGSFLDITTIGTEASLRFVIAEPAGTDLIVEIESSTTLQGGSPAGWKVIASRIGSDPWTGTAPVSMAPAGDGLVEVTVTQSVTSDPKRFYRLKTRLAP